MRSLPDVPEPPVGPLGIELTVSQTRYWWQSDDGGDDEPARVQVSADVHAFDACPEDIRHVGDIELVYVAIDGERNLLDVHKLGEWALRFIAKTVVSAEGALHPDLESRVSAGPPFMVVVQHIKLTEDWRGHGLGGPLLAAALRRFRRHARLAICRIGPGDFPALDRQVALDPVSRLIDIVERMGFRSWHGVYFVDLGNPALLDTRRPIMSRWGPEPEADQQ